MLKYPEAKEVTFQTFKRVNNHNTNRHTNRIIYKFKLLDEDIWMTLSFLSLSEETSVII